MRVIGFQTFLCRFKLRSPHNSTQQIKRGSGKDCTPTKCSKLILKKATGRKIYPFFSSKDQMW